MPKPAPGGADGAGRKEINPLIISAQAQRELLQQKNFGALWGELISPDFPKSFEEVLAARKAELARLTAQTGAESGSAPTWETSTRATQQRKEGLGNLETGLGKAYRVLKSGI